MPSFVSVPVLSSGYAKGQDTPNQIRGLLSVWKACTITAMFRLRIHGTSHRGLEECLNSNPAKAAVLQSGLLNLVWDGVRFLIVIMWGFYLISVVV